MYTSILNTCSSDFGGTRLCPDGAGCVPSVIGPVIRQGEQKLDSLLFGQLDNLIEPPETILSLICADQ